MKRRKPKPVEWTGWGRLFRGKFTVNGFERQLCIYASEAHAKRAACYGEEVIRVRVVPSSPRKRKVKR